MNFHLAWIVRVDMAPLSVEDLEQAVAAALQAQVPPAQGGSQRSFTKQKKGLKHGDFT